MFKAARWRSDKNKIKSVFKLQFHATQIVGDGLTIAVIPGDSGKPTARLEKAKVKDGCCYWEKPHFETVKFTQDQKTGKFNEKIYRFVVATGSSIFGVVGEVSLDFSSYAEATKVSSVSLSLKNSKAASLLHVSIQRVQDQREADGNENVNGDNKILRTELNNGDKEGSLRNDPSEDQGVLTDKIKRDRKASSGSDITLSCSDSSSGLDTPRQPELKNTKLTHESSTVTISEEQQRSSKWDWLDGSVHELSTDDSSMTSQREALSAEISEEGSPDDVIRKLKGELLILSRQAEVSDMELQTLRKQIVKESKKGQDLSKEVASLKEERNKMKEEFEKMKVKVNINSNLSSEGGDPWALVDELKQELNHEKDLNSNLRLQLQKTQESNAELILAVQDLDEMLEQKQKSNSSVDPKSQEVNTKPETDDDDDEDQKALMEIVREHSGLQDVHLQEQKIIDLYNEIELYKRDKDDLEMQMEQIALDYEILKQENHDMSYKLEQSEIQEQLKMQYECSTSYATVNELEAHIEHLDNELKTKSKELSESVLAIKELETLVKNLEEDLDNQAHGFEADMEDLIRAKVEQEQRAIRAEDNLRKVKLQNANTAGKLQEEFRRLSTEMSSAFKENESAAMRAMDEATQLRVEKRNLEEMIKKLQEELQYLGEQYEDKLVNLSNQLTLKSQQFDECNANFEKLQAENQNLDGERHSLENEIRVVKMEMSELRNVKKDKDNEVERLQSEIERLKTRCNDMKQFFKECESEKENLKKQVSQLKGDLKKKDEAVSVMEKKLKEASKLAARNNKPVPVSRTPKEVTNMKDRIKLLEDQIKLKESALEFSEASFLEKEKDLQQKIEELEKRLEILDQHTENPQVSRADQTRDQEISEASSNEMELLNKNKSMEIELKEMQERYSEISLKFAEVEGERQQLVMTLRNIKNAKKC
ncbi:myosin heavy chain-related protein [Artemisia annua]|uniref:Myosin heavy chain-related protein n=1 Tax=Artemisia annua TaxID=35608 RepID=A0A2U1QEA0_ARTAN|nr:myosin heavy chain-related protein [Artemisia annua]